jgi:hypothetical protein
MLLSKAHSGARNMFMAKAPVVLCEECLYEKMCMYKFRLASALEGERDQFYSGPDEDDELVIQEITVTNCSLRKT